MNVIFVSRDGCPKDIAKRTLVGRSRWPDGPPPTLPFFHMIEEMQHVAVELLAILKKREVADLGLKQEAGARNVEGGAYRSSAACSWHHRKPGSHSGIIPRCGVRCEAMSALADQ